MACFTILCFWVLHCIDRQVPMPTSVPLVFLLLLCLTANSIAWMNNTNNSLFIIRLSVFMSAVGNICEPWRVFSNVAAFIVTQNKTMAFCPLWHFVPWHCPGFGRWCKLTLNTLSFVSSRLNAPVELSTRCIHRCRHNDGDSSTTETTEHRIRTAELDKRIPEQNVA